MVLKVIINCEKCGAKYSVPENKIPAEGRNVRCSKCSYTWFIQNPKSQDDVFLPSNQKNQTEQFLTAKKEDKIEQIDSQLPVVHKTNFFIFYKILISILIALLIFITLIFHKERITKLMPISKHLYELFSIYDSSSFIFNDVKFSKNVVNGITNVSINGSMLNNSNISNYVPFIKVSLLNKDKKVILSHIMDPGSVLLKPGESYNINNKITNITKTAEYINLDIGNKIELIFRP